MFPQWGEHCKIYLAFLVYVLKHLNNLNVFLRVKTSLYMTHTKAEVQAVEECLSP
jgi:hypothetical protein